MRTHEDRPTSTLFAHSARTSIAGPAKRRRSLKAAALSGSLLATALLAPAQADSRATGTATRAGATARAHAARTFTLNESGSMHLTSKHGFRLNEQGTATGTITGTIYAHLTIVSSKRVTAEVNFYPRSGSTSISVVGSASYSRRPTFAVFSGTVSIARGTGSYSRARGSGLSFSGTIQRSNDAVTVHVSGRVSE